MNPSQTIDIIKFIRGNSSSSLVVESNAHAEPLAQVLFESAQLYKVLQTSNNLDIIIEQIIRKNTAAKEYQSITGKKWLF
jgi:hypothetical protein